MRHPDDLDPLFVIDEPRVDFLESIRVFQGDEGVPKVHLVLAKVVSGFAVVPFVSHAILLPDIGRGCKQAQRLSVPGRAGLFGKAARLTAAAG